MAFWIGVGLGVLLGVGLMWWLQHWAEREAFKDFWGP